MADVGDCKNCKQPIRSYYPRGLCRKCFMNTEIRRLYPVLRCCYTSQGHGIHPSDGKAMAGRPTRALPGTEEKIQVLEQRAARGEYLWHPRDATRRLK